MFSVRIVVFREIVKVCDCRSDRYLRLLPQRRDPGGAQNVPGNRPGPETRHVEIHPEAVVHFRNLFCFLITHWLLSLLTGLRMQPC
jgi:hypothetical protein